MFATKQLLAWRGKNNKSAAPGQRRREPGNRKRRDEEAQKLVNQDKIFMMLAHTGTAQNLAAMPVQFEKNIVNFYPVTAAREM